MQKQQQCEKLFDAPLVQHLNNEAEIQGRIILIDRIASARVFGWMDNTAATLLVTFKDDKTCRFDFYTTDEESAASQAEEAHSRIASLMNQPQ